MPRHNYTAEELELLTEDERQGLLDDTLVDEGEFDAEDGTEEGTATAVEWPSISKEPVAPAQQQAPQAEEADQDADTDPDEAATPPSAPPAATEPPAPAGGQDAPAEADLELEAAPQLKDFDPEIEEYKTQLRDIAQKFDDGHISAVERIDLEMGLQEKLQSARLQRELQVNQESMRRNTFLHETVPTFLAANPVYGQSEAALTELDAVTRRLQDEAINAGRDPLSPKILLQADRIIRQRFEPWFVSSPAPKSGSKPPPKRELPPDLNSVPAAEGPDGVDGGHYAHLDRMAEKDPLAFERELSKMSEAAVDAYLARG